MSQDPMFLPDVETHPKPGPWADNIPPCSQRARSIRRSGICLRFVRMQPSISRASRRRSCAARRPLEPGMRELIAAFTSASGIDCPF